MTAPPRNFREFWPFYMQAHLDARCRALHYLGTSGGAVCAVLAVATLNPAWLVVGLLWGYGCAWAGHFGFEHNRPAAFVRPWWSFLGDWRMWALWLTGRLGPHLEQARTMPSLDSVLSGAAAHRS